MFPQRIVKSFTFIKNKYHENKNSDKIFGISPINNDVFQHIQNIKYKTSIYVHKIILRNVDSNSGDNIYVHSDIVRSGLFINGQFSSVIGHCIADEKEKNYTIEVNREYDQNFYQNPTFWITFDKNEPINLSEIDIYVHLDLVSTKIDV